MTATESFYDEFCVCYNHKTFPVSPSLLPWNSNFGSNFCILARFSYDLLLCICVYSFIIIQVNVKKLVILLLLTQVWEVKASWRDESSCLEATRRRLIRFRQPISQTLLLEAKMLEENYTYQLLKLMHFKLFSLWMFE